MHLALLAAGESASHPSWPWVFLPPLIAAVLTATFNQWFQHPRARLRLVAGAMTVEDQTHLWRANNKKHNWYGHLNPVFLRLTNYGNGPAFDIQLSGVNCRPRVWVQYAPTSEGTLEEVDPAPEMGMPMWSDNITALQPGETVTIFVMTTTDTMVGKPKLTVTWPRLPQLGWWRKSINIELTDPPRLEMGWPGEGGNTLK